MIIFETTRDTTFNKQLSFSSGQRKIVSAKPCLCYRRLTISFKLWSCFLIYFSRLSIPLFKFLCVYLLTPYPSLLKHKTHQRRTLACSVLYLHWLLKSHKDNIMSQIDNAQIHESQRGKTEEKHLGRLNIKVVTVKAARI